MRYLILAGACLLSGLTILFLAVHIRQRRAAWSRLSGRIHTGTMFFGTQVRKAAQESRGRIEQDAAFLHDHFERMFMNVSVDRCMQISWAAPLAMALVGLILSWRLHWLANIVLMVLFAQGGRMALRAVVRFLYGRYVDKFDAQLTDALTMASNTIRVGLSLPQAMEIVVKEMPSPVSQEFQLALKEHRFGKSLDEALDRMANRLPSADLALVVNAVLILRETGGSLSETFDTIVNTIMEREKVKAKIRTLTAQGRVQGIILTGMPFGLAYLLHLINPQYIEPLFTTYLGWAMLLFMLLLLVSGGLLIRKIITIDV